ncbi:MAG TPA: hypothetical protein VM261_03550 [Kofleriaceae bacterium]|nr:hypothetical protein [Kofleriaceae bacterium]
MRLVEGAYRACVLLGIVAIGVPIQPYLTSVTLFSSSATSPQMAEPHTKAHSLTVRLGGRAGAACFLRAPQVGDECREQHRHAANVDNEWYPQPWTQLRPRND